jgi:hypothetical protein
MISRFCRLFRTKKSTASTDPVGNRKSHGQTKMKVSTMQVALDRGMIESRYEDTTYNHNVYL